MRKTLLAALAAATTASGLIGLPTTAHAVTTVEIGVNTTSMANDLNPGDGFCEIHEGQRDCGLLAAFDEMNAAAGTDSYLINVPEGRYVFPRDLEPKKVATVTGAGPATIFDGGDSTDELFDASWEMFTLERVSLQNATKRAVFAEADIVLDGVEAHGNSGQYPVVDAHDGADVTIRDSNFYDNTATDSIGGAVYADGDSLTIVNTTFSNNISRSGAAVYSEAATTTLDNVVASGNTASVDGGAIYVTTGDLEITNSEFTDNTARDYGVFSANGGSVEIAATTFSNNHSSEGVGIGYARRDLSLVEVDANDNTAGSMVSGFQSGGDITIDSSSFTGNTSDGWMGVIDGYAEGNTITVRNSTFADNSVGGPELSVSPFSGAAISGHANLDVLASTFWKNTSAHLDGMAIATSGSVSLKGSIVAGSGDKCLSPEDRDTVFAHVLTDTAGCLSGPGVTEAPGGDTGLITPELPMTETYVPVEAGSAAMTLEGWNADNGCPELDQLGTTRPNPGLCTVGAWEYTENLQPVAQDLTSTGVGTQQQSATVVLADDETVELLKDGVPADNTVTTAAGTWTLDPSTGVITFDPKLGFAGEAKITFRVSNGDLSTDSTYTATVTKPTPPANPGNSSSSGTGVQSTNVTIPAGGWVTLVDGSGHSGNTVTVPGKGTFTIDPATGKVTFTPEPGFSGEASVTIKVTDAYGQSTQFTFKASVTGAPGTPTASAQPGVEQPATSAKVWAWAKPTSLGLPKATKKSRGGAYIGVKGEKWKIALRGANRANPTRYKVVITADKGTLKKLRKLSVERHDKVKVKGKKITLRLRAKNGIDGLVFATTTATNKITVKIKANGKRLKAKRIYLGKDLTRATTSTVVINRELI